MKKKPIYAELEQKIHLLERELSYHKNLLKKKTVFEELTKTKKELEEKKATVEKLDKTIDMLVKNRQEGETEIYEDIMSNINQLVLPYLERLKGNISAATRATLLSIVESNLKEISSPIAKRLSTKWYVLSPMEVKVANLVKTGAKSREIAEILNISKQTILSHRFRIRSKLGIHNKKVGLRTFLQSIG